MAAKKKKESNRAKVRAYTFNVNGDVVLVVVARSKEDAVTRFVKDGGPESVAPDSVGVRFAY